MQQNDSLAAGSQVFSPRPEFELTVPAITEHWQLSLTPGQASPCAYDPSHYRWVVSVCSVAAGVACTLQLMPGQSDSQCTMCVCVFLLLPS